MPTSSEKTLGFSRAVTDIQEALSIQFNTLVYELRKKGKTVIVLSLGEPYFDIPLWPMDKLPNPEIHHYSHSRGIPELRRRLCDYYQGFGLPVDLETEILITAGSKAAIYMTFLSILNPSDEVLVPEPYWVSYPEQIKLCYGQPVSIPFPADVASYEKYITAKTKAIVVASPNNPRGHIYDPEELEQLLRLAERHGLWLLCDEAYSDFAPAGQFRSIGSLDPVKKHTVVFNSISKNFGISGWRLGYVIAQPELIQKVYKVNQHLLTCPATLLEYYVATYFDRFQEATRPQVRRLMDLRGQVADCLTAAGLSFLPGQGTFYFFVSIARSSLDSKEFCLRLLNEEAVCAVPGIGYGASCDRYIRLSIGTAPLSDIKIGIAKIKALIDRTAA